MQRDELLEYLATFLSVEKFSDYAPNGLQVEGRSDIHKIVTAVTASQSAIKKAIEEKADALLVHHGYFWKGESPVITGMKKRRLSMLLSEDINLFAYHLPLDCHLEIGNNAEIARRLNINNVKQHIAGGVPQLLWTGTLKQPTTASKFADSLAEIFRRAPQHIEGNKDLISHVAWCSGGAQDFIEEAARLGVDAYVSGEISERTYYASKELGVHYFSAGHHATERYGIQALGEHLSKKFGVKHFFFDEKNPI